MVVEGLYDRGYIVNYKEGDKALFRTQQNYVSSIYDRYHTIVDNESLYDIARRYYKSSGMWYLIADANNIITDIFNLPIGEVIVIPNNLVITYGQS